MFQGIVSGRVGQVEINDKGTRAIINVASNSKIDGKDVTHWARCTLFGEKIIAAVATKLGKGALVTIAFNCQNNTYEKDGVKHYSTDFIVERLDVLKWPVRTPTSTDANDQTDQDSVPF
jgi:single-strand DNA-binding protein